MKIILYLFWWSEILGDSNQQNCEIMRIQKSRESRLVHGSNFYGEGVKILPHSDLFDIIPLEPE